MKSMELSLNEKCTKIIGNKFLNLYGGVKRKEGSFIWEIVFGSMWHILMIY